MIFYHKQGKKMARHIATILLIAVCFFLRVEAVKAVEPQTFNAILLSRLDFAPRLLEMISAELTRKTGQNFSLTVQSLETFSAGDTPGSSDVLLVEKGLNRAILPQNFHLAGTDIKLVWVLAAARHSGLTKANQKLSLARFIEILENQRRIDPDRFPWFEPLLSRNSMRNLCLLLGDKKKSKRPFRRRAQAISEQTSAAEVLYRAIESELLNPLSVEADLSLAMEVFAAGDTMFASQWVTLALLAGTASPPDWLQQVTLLPFPSLAEKSILPVMTLEVWKSADADRSWPARPENSLPNDSTILYDLNFASETAWIEEKYLENYDALVVGDL